MFSYPEVSETLTGLLRSIAARWRTFAPRTLATTLKRPRAVSSVASAFGACKTQVRSTTNSDCYFPFLPIALFYWELPLLFPVGTNESLCLPNRFRVGFIAETIRDTGGDRGVISWSSPREARGSFLVTPVVAVSSGAKERAEMKMSEFFKRSLTSRFSRQHKVLILSRW